MYLTILVAEPIYVILSIWLSLPLNLTVCNCHVVYLTNAVTLSKWLSLPLSCWIFANLCHFIYLTIYGTVYIFNDLCRFVYLSHVFISSLLWWWVHYIFHLCWCVTASYFAPVCTRHCVIFCSRGHASLRHIFLLCSRVTASYFSPVFMRHCVIFVSRVHASLRHIFLLCSCVTASTLPEDIVSSPCCTFTFYPILSYFHLRILFRFRTFTIGSFPYFHHRILFILSP